MTATMAPKRDGHAPTILVVEEDSRLLENIVGQLENSGYAVQKSKKGKDGLHLIAEQQPNLILASTTLPDLKGIQFYKAAREAIGDHADFLFLASQDCLDDPTIRQTMTLEGFLTKPFSNQTLLATVKARVQSTLKPGTMQADEDISSVSLLVVEDDMAMLVALRDILEGTGYRVSTATNGKEALERFRDVSPSLVLSDISMPIMDGIELFEAVRQLPGGKAVPFIFLTARGTRQDVFAGMSLGADDYITKPVTSQELISAVKARLTRANELLVAQLKIAYKSSLLALANAIEARDQYTHDHVLRTNAYAQALALELGWSESEREILGYGAILHDIGKLEVPVNILQKEEHLTPDEWVQMRRHPAVGGHMISGIDYLAQAVPIIHHHHERWDGNGYPDGLQGDEIPLGARLLAVADSFEALTTDRPYRKAISPKEACEEIAAHSGTKYDPEMIAAFLSCWDRGTIQDIINNAADTENEDTKS
jgi:putative two-component system response regulator